jgi:mannose-6-phosphate isomerase-like protein (cupin superfamily)
VLEGSVEFHMDFYSPLSLSVGDSVYFDASVPHIFVSTGEGDALILSITSQLRALSLPPDD